MALEDTKSQSSGSNVCIKVGSSDKAVRAMSEAYDEMTRHIADTKACAKVLSDLLQEHPSADPVGTIKDMLGKTTECFQQCTKEVQSLDNMMILPRLDQDDTVIKTMLVQAAPVFKRLVSLNGDLHTFIVSKKLKKDG